MTKNEFYKTVVESVVTITSTEKNEFEGSVLEYVIKFPTSWIPAYAAAQLWSAAPRSKSVVGGQM